MPINLGVEPQDLELKAYNVYLEGDDAKWLRELSNTTQISLRELMTDMYQVYRQQVDSKKHKPHSDKAAERAAAEADRAAKKEERAAEREKAKLEREEAKELKRQLREKEKEIAAAQAAKESKSSGKGEAAAKSNKSTKSGEGLGHVDKKPAKSEDYVVDAAAATLGITVKDMKAKLEEGLLIGEKSASTWTAYLPVGLDAKPKEKRLGLAEQWSKAVLAKVRK